MSKWQMVKLGDVLEYEQPTKYIVKSTLYNDNFFTPVLTAGQTFILGYTNEIENIFTNLPVIIFDDFTTATKYVDFPFKVKSSAMKILKATDTAHLKFLYYHMTTIKVDTELHKRYWISRYAELQIPLPPLEEQKKIAEELDNITDLIAKRKSQQTKLDLLVKAKFVEMFGDPINNPMGWENKTVIDYCDCMVPGRDKPKKFTGSIPWITIDDLIINGFTKKSKKNLGLTQAEITQVNRKTIPSGSVIMSCVGNLGICTISLLPVIINQQLHSFQCKPEMNNVFLMHYLGKRKDYMNSQASSTTVLYMNKSVCNSIPTICPPLPLQNKFADYVTKVEKQKEIIQKALLKLEILYNARMQEYFE